MKVNEIFSSLQGEGIRMGQSTTFIRFCGCSVGCIWCDTKYAWEECNFDMTPEQIVGVVRGSSPRTVCLTGGEPLEQDQEDLQKLCVLLHKYGYDVTIETSATDDLDGDSRPLIWEIDLWTISPKLANARPKKEPNMVTIEDVCEFGCEVQLKFVVASEQDVIDVKRFLEKEEFDDYQDIPIVLQPESYAATQDMKPCLHTERLYRYLKRLEEIHEWAYQNRLLDVYDVRILPQLHYLIWGRRRGK